MTHTSPKAARSPHRLFLSVSIPIRIPVPYLPGPPARNHLPSYARVCRARSTSVVDAGAGHASGGGAACWKRQTSTLIGADSNLGGDSMPADSVAYVRAEWQLNTPRQRAAMAQRAVHPKRGEVEDCPTRPAARPHHTNVIPEIPLSPCHLDSLLDWVHDSWAVQPQLLSTVPYSRT
ncbi:hypothetical protein B0H13DRAFT_2276487 [Mycena leptocephala]|nr:hypothetical protein B0H13DRAFT_2276487 [Mycena leptocephala]